MNRPLLPIALSILASLPFWANWCAATETVQPDESRFEKRVLVPACQDPMQLDVSARGDVYFIERGGAIKVWRAANGVTRLLGSIQTAVYGEVGLLGLALDPGFADNGWAYVVYSPQERQHAMRLARLTLSEDAIAAGSERVLLEYRIDPKANHMGGALEFGPDGCLYMGTGDNCPPIPETPLDRRPGRVNFDAMRTSGNSMDLRGSILRIRPKLDGTYGIPEGNLFTDRKEGLPEIYAMGCRNPFRFCVDPKTNWLIWGDVGPNILPRLGPEGYDEINLTGQAGNFGWPMFVGPNEPYSRYDFATDAVGESFDAANPINDSPNNTGLRRLPPPRPALIWYPSGDSKDFPELGSGARTAMAGFVYRNTPSGDPQLKLPAYYDGKLFIYDWTRNWIKAVELDSEGRIVKIEPFLNHLRFRKPMDMKIGPDGTVYVIEYGDHWFGNSDAQIVRIVYQRGNRAPVAVVTASPLAGKHPLTVTFNGKESYDRDENDRMKYAWNFGNAGETVSTEHSPTFTYISPGVYAAELRVTDSHGESSTAKLQIAVGNSIPRVTILEPPNGGFFDWGTPIGYRVDVADDEDGIGTQVAAQRISLMSEYQLRRPGSAEGVQYVEPGLALMQKSTCFACHARDRAGLGPAYAAIAAKYRGDAAAHDVLAKKVLSGGAGVWGTAAMPPHPQHTSAEAEQMVDWVLSLADNPTLTLSTGSHGQVAIPNEPPAARHGGVYLIDAAYTDNGTSQAPPLSGQAGHVLHDRRKTAVFCDEARGVEITDVFEGGIRQAGRFGHGDYLAYYTMNLREVSRVVVRYAAPHGLGGELELRRDAPTGPLLATLGLPPTGEWHLAKQATAAIRDPGGTHNLYLVARSKGDIEEKLFNLEWIEFQK